MSQYDAAVVMQHVRAMEAQQRQMADMLKVRASEGARRTPPRRACASSRLPRAHTPNRDQDEESVRGRIGFWV